MLIAILSVFILAFIAPGIRVLFRGFSGWILALLPAALTVYFARFLPEIASGGAVRESIPWVSAFGGINLSFSLDGLSLLFALLICGIGTFIIIYAGGYLSKHKNQGRFFSFMLMFMGSMLGLVLADNVITLFVFWELTSITSFLLIGFDHHRKASRRAAVQALVVTGGGGFALLAGLLLMAGIGGSLELSDLLNRGDLFREHSWYPVVLTLILVGAFTKSAQVPFHFWLPNAMEAPTPVSAYLHSATMVKAGVYLLARVHPALGGTDLWFTVLTAFGALTFLTGTILGIRQTDLKLMLAYTTVASLGLLVMLLGLGNENKYAVIAAISYLFAHSLFKGALFMVAGGIDHSTGTRQAPQLGGLMSIMPITAFASFLAVLSMAGLPPFIGFLAKEIIYEGTLHATPETVVLIVTIIAVIGNALMGAIAGLAGVGPFIGERTETPKTPHESPPSLWAGPLVLAVLGLATALFLNWTQVHVIGPAVNAVWGESIKIDLYLWAGLKPPVYLSALTVAGAIVLFLYGRRIGDGLRALTGSWWGPDKGYDQALTGLRLASRALTRLLQNGELHAYMIIVFIVFAAALFIPMTLQGAWPALPELPPFDYYVLSVCGLVVLGAIVIVMARSRLQAILSMGVLGFSVGFIFMLFGAPDLAFTQFMVETLSVVILSLVLLRLPVQPTDHRPAVAAWRDAAIAAFVGVSVTLLLIGVVADPLDLKLTEYFSANSYPEAKGRNIVNVILVDFRALDTLGEIFVLVTAAVAALALINTAAGRRPVRTKP